MQTKVSNQQIHVITLGCSKNLVDSEVLMHQLRAGGLTVSHQPGQVEGGVVVINTCGFINDAKEESIDTILDFAEARKAGRIEGLYVMGCLSERYRKDLQQEMHEVDGFFGVAELPEILAAIGADYRRELLGERVVTTPPHYAYLKVSEGCDRSCSFCAIPLIRGKHRSKSIEEIVSEARYLASQGVKELMLIAQDLTYYGLDLYKKRMLPELVQQLTGVDGIEWIRLHYAYPAGFPDELLQIIKDSPKVCNYLDIPLQHISDHILRSMRRGHTGQQTRELIRKIRTAVPGIALRTTLIVGYPGETQEDFEELKAFVQESRFERLGVFTYSHEEDTHAWDLVDDIPQEEKEQRAAALMELQEQISAEINQHRVGQQLRVIIDRREGDFWIGRSQYDSPEVDNEVLIPANAVLQPGRIYQVRITGAEAFDLYAEVEEG